MDGTVPQHQPTTLLPLEVRDHMTLALQHMLLDPHPRWCRGFILRFRDWLPFLTDRPSVAAFYRKQIERLVATRHT